MGCEVGCEVVVKEDGERRVYVAGSGNMSEGV